MGTFTRGPLIILKPPDTDAIEITRQACEVLEAFGKRLVITNSPCGSRKICIQLIDPEKIKNTNDMGIEWEYTIDLHALEKREAN